MITDYQDRRSRQDLLNKIREMEERIEALEILVSQNNKGVLLVGGGGGSAIDGTVRASGGGGGRGDRPTWNASHIAQVKNPKNPRTNNCV